jgi:hypothetical protein
VQESIRYAHQKGRHSFNFTVSDLCSYVAILFTTGFNKRPQEWMYWSKDEAIECPFIAKIMSSKRFQEIKRNIHFCNNNELKKNDKFAKIRPLVDLVRKSLSQFGVFSKRLCIDEQMIPFSGRHSCKMYMKNKPIRFGYKSWILCNENGYPFDFSLYQGADASRVGPLASSVVLRLLKIVTKPENHEVYFDNFFTSYSLLVDLKLLGFRATGTIRKNRTKGCPLTSDSDFKKEYDRGEVEVWHDGSVAICQWNDSKVVHVATNFDECGTGVTVDRWVKAKRVRLDVQQPHVIRNYNLYMGGVDLLDNALSNLRPTIRCRKW